MSGRGEVLAVSHIGLCASDVDRSLRFYTEGLGVAGAEGWDIGDSSRSSPWCRLRCTVYVDDLAAVERDSWPSARRRSRTPGRTSHGVRIELVQQGSA